MITLIIYILTLLIASSTISLRYLEALVIIFMISSLIICKYNSNNLIMISYINIKISSDSNNCNKLEYLYLAMAMAMAELGFYQCLKKKLN